MHQLKLPSSIINRIIDDPADLSFPSKIGISVVQSDYILGAGYTKGFRAVFILNATLTALATLASIVLIKHKELIRADENKLKALSVTHEMEKTVPLRKTDSDVADTNKNHDESNGETKKDATVTAGSGGV